MAASRKHGVAAGRFLRFGFTHRRHWGQFSKGRLDWQVSPSSRLQVCLISFGRLAGLANSFTTSIFVHSTPVSGLRGFWGLHHNRC